MLKVKQIFFTVITLTLVPLLFFGGLELALVTAGVGTSYEYFRKIEIDGVPHLQENPAFAKQFYPASLNIGPLENTFAEAKPDSLVRVYVLGGSAAMGFPLRNHAVSRLITTQLAAAIPGKEIEVINTAMTSVNSHVVFEVAKTLPQDSADVAVILMGNNEVVGPYGPGTFNQNFLSSLKGIRTLQFLKRTRTWQALETFLLSITPTDAGEALEWEGMQMFTNNGVVRDDPRMQNVYQHYQENLTDMIKLLNDKGMHVVLSTVPVNLRHSAPFLSVNDAALSEQQLTVFEQHINEGNAALERSEWTAAIGAYQGAIAIDNQYADAHFGLATALENNGQLPKSRYHFEQALDLDALRFRADSEINAIVRHTGQALNGSQLTFVDSAVAFDEASQPFAPGWNLILEHVHYDFPGNAVLARVLTHAILEHLDDGRARSLLTDEEVAARIGFPNHETLDNIKNLQGMAKNPPFPGQSNYDQFLTFLDDLLAEVTEQVGTPQDVLQRRQAVIQADTADWKIYFELAAIAKYLRNDDAQYKYLTRLDSKYPHNRESQINLADLLLKQGKWREAIAVLEGALAYSRDHQEKSAGIIGRLGTAYFKVDEVEIGTELLLTIPRDYPDQIGLSLRAYGNLIKNASDAGRREKISYYADEAQGYAKSLIRQGKDKDYPLLSRRMASLMTLAGYKAEAKMWQQGRIPNK